jgi:alanyl-tRNA synthetase
MRRGMRHSHLLGSKEPVFYNLFETLRDEMSGNYPELVRADSLIKETLKMEEEKFLVLLDRGIKILNEEISKINQILPGEIAFKLYETYGFPIDLTEDILKSKSLKFDKERFGELMRESVELAKKNWKGSGDSAIEKIWYNIKEKNGTTEFLGYENNQSQGVIKCLLKSHKEVSILVEGDEAIIVVNQTPFYGESGGQVGDTGEIVADNFKFEVTDTQKKLGDLIVHYGKVKEGSIKLDDIVSLKINAERRKDMRAYHSATHLLHESLRRVLGTHVTQKGSLVEPNRLRFDFSHIKPILNEEIDKIENYVNTMISKKSDVRTRLMTPDEAVENGALALFGEKYGAEVRVLSMGDDDGKYFSTELCGGTHVKNTGDIGKFKIISQSSIASGVRRIEALRDRQLEDYLKNKEKLSNISSEKNEEIIKSLSEQIIKLGGKPTLSNDDQKTLIKNLTKQLETLTVNSILQDKTKNIIIDEEINGTKIRFQNVNGLPPKELRKLVDKGKKELIEGVVIVFANKDDKVGIAVGVTDNLTSQFDAVKFVKVGSEIIGGKGGGGRKDFAQAGGQDQSKIDQAFEQLKTLI